MIIMKYCKKCLYPDTKPQLKFNDDGICEACLNSDKKDSVDWESRKKQLKEIAEKYRKSDGTYAGFERDRAKNGDVVKDGELILWGMKAMP